MNTPSSDHSHESQPLADDELDPLFVHARREAIEIVLVVALAAAWCVGYSAYAGYGRPEAGPIPTIAGFPAWVWWGIVVPWGVTALFTCWYSLCRMRRDPLPGEEG